MFYSYQEEIILLRWVLLSSPNPTGVSHFFMAINIEAFRPLIDFKNQMDDMIQLLKNSPLAKVEMKYLLQEKKNLNMKSIIIFMVFL